MDNAATVGQSSQVKGLWGLSKVMLSFLVYIGLNTFAGAVTSVEYFCRRSNFCDL